MVDIQRIFLPNQEKDWPMYAVTGATGQLGRLVIEALLKTIPADRIVAAVRDPEKGKDLAQHGVIVREADYSRPETLGPAFAGVEKLLLISSTEVVGRLPRHRAVIDAATQAGVSLIAYTSMLHAGTSPAMLADEHRQTEEVIAASGLPAVILRNGWYTENHLMAFPMALEYGAFVGAAKDGRFSSAARQDYAEAAAMVLASEGHAGKTYELAADQAYSLAELAAEVSRQSGKSVVYNDLSEAAYREVLTSAGLPSDLAGLLADADVAASCGALFDDSGALGRLIGRPTTLLQSMVAAAFRD
ncbi:SDR family oxidoreductase [Neorhizobium alkalisoli]|nr:SDR family oxidoreductase [Neorhizobium alkalisoli]